MLLGLVVTLAYIEAPASSGLKFVWEYERSDIPHYGVRNPAIGLGSRSYKLTRATPNKSAQVPGGLRLTTVLEALGLA